MRYEVKVTKAVELSKYLKIQELKSKRWQTEGKEIVR